MLDNVNGADVAAANAIVIGLSTLENLAIKSKLLTKLH